MGAILPGVRVPFELIVDGVHDAANFTLKVEAEPSSESPRQNFELSGLRQWVEEDDYCLEGVGQSTDDSVQNYLVIVAILYDEGGNVVNFGNYYDSNLEVDKALNLEICVGPHNQGVAHFELRAWGLRGLGRRQCLLSKQRTPTSARCVTDTEPTRLGKEVVLIGQTTYASFV